jgi:Flp pilus assembly protein TadG
MLAPTRSAYLRLRLLGRHNLAGQQGSALVETALSLSVLLVFIFGVMEVSLMAYTYHFVSEAAREGTRYAIVRGSTCNQISTAMFPTACPASDTEIATYVKGLGFPGIDPSKMNVTTSWLKLPAGTACTGCNTVGNGVKVGVTYTFPFSIPFVPYNSYTLSSTSVMVIAH